MFYLPKASEAGTSALYRLYKASGLDHMDSLTFSEMGYSTEFTIGYPYNNQVTGTNELRRWYKPAINNHVTAFYGENVAAYGYNQESVQGYGYKRYGNSGEKLVTVTGNEVVLKANLVAGGAISELSWNGKQFVNDWDYGRQIQTAVSFVDPNSGQSSEEDNPTEAGDIYGWPRDVWDAGWSHGSPLLSYSINGKTISTTTSPLQWKPEKLAGGGPDNPVRWKGTMSKVVTLDYGSNNAIKYGTQIYFPMAQPHVRAEVVTAYLNAEFTKFYLYNAATNSLTDITASCPLAGYAKIPGPRNGGIIIATPDGLYALGGYHRDPGYDAWFQCANFTNQGGQGKYGKSTSKWSIYGAYPSYSVAAGTTESYTNYLTVGTLSTAISEMKRLYQAGL
jgi:hypothetical protein